MRHGWVWGMSVLMSALVVGGTLFFFMRMPTDEGTLEALPSPATAPSNLGLDSKAKPEERLALARQLKTEGSYDKAREILKHLIQTSSQVPFIEEIEKEYWDTNLHLLFSNQRVEGWTQEVTVQKGDSLASIAERNHGTVELLKESNRLESDLIHPGQTLRAFTGEFSILVDKSLNTLILKVNGEAIKVYRVGTGTRGSTPVGEFKVATKLKNPVWHHEGKVIPFGDPRNILGTRWMGFDLKGYGIHGTTDPASIGKQSSAGCVRLTNEEVEELYKIVPAGTPVSIVE